MKTITEMKFDRIIKEGFQKILKPLGFKKKGNNFYLQLDDLGQIINIQKSVYLSKDHIKFNINTGIFLPEYFLGYYNYHNNQIPIYPTEPVCFIRKRIGSIRKQIDTWYEIDEKTEEQIIICEMHDNLNRFILPYFKNISTKKDILNLLENEYPKSSSIANLIVYGEFKLFDKSQNELDLIMADNRLNEEFKLKIKNEYGVKYNLK